MKTLTQREQRNTLRSRFNRAANAYDQMEKQLIKEARQHYASQALTPELLMDYRAREACTVWGEDHDHGLYDTLMLELGLCLGLDYQDVRRYQTLVGQLNLGIDPKDLRTEDRAFLREVHARVKLEEAPVRKSRAKHTQDAEPLSKETKQLKQAVRIVNRAAKQNLSRKEARET